MTSGTIDYSYKASHFRRGRRISLNPSDRYASTDDDGSKSRFAAGPLTRGVVGRNSNGGSISPIAAAVPTDSVGWNLAISSSTGGRNWVYEASDYRVHIGRTYVECAAR